MKRYPKITEKVYFNENVYAFDKLDGNLIRAEWSRRKGFYKFGTSTKIIQADNLDLGLSVSLLLSKYGDSLSKIFQKDGYERVVSFFEYGSPSSRFGILKDPPFYVTLLDVWVIGEGIIHPKVFLDKFGGLGIPKLVYNGVCDQNFVELVKSSTIVGVTHEGVVCKGRYFSPGRPLIFKIKTDKWLKDLREFSSGNDELYRLLS